MDHCGKEHGERVGRKRDGQLFVVSGPSGSGKSTLVREAIRQTNAQLSVSATTRPQGKNEIDGKDYYFLSEKEFKDKIGAEEFLEYARVFDNYYGTPRQPVIEKLNAGQTVLLEIDVQGAAQVFESFPEAVGILVLPPSDEELYRRLQRRGRDDAETIKKRLAKAQWEIEQARNSKNFKHTLINEDLGEAIKAMIELIGYR